MTTRKLITHEAIDCIRRIGRDEVGRVTTIGLTELDALCDDADYLLDRVVELESLEGRLALADALLASEKQLCACWSERDEAKGRADAAERLALGLGELVMRHWSTRSPMRGLPVDWAAQVDSLREKWKKETGT